MAQNTKKDLIQVKNRSFLNKDFESFRAELLEFARTYFPEKIQDFSDASLGGLFLDLASYVGVLFIVIASGRFDKNKS